MPRHVVYVALGPYRTQAATHHASTLAAQGAKVDLVVADGPAGKAWAHVALPDGVTLHRGERLLFANGGPLADADLLVAGDPAAMPVAWAAARRRPDLVMRLEPAAEPERRPASADLAVVTPWYPSPDNALVGAFVKATVGAVAGSAGRVSILHAEHWSQSREPERVEVAADRFAARFGAPVVTDLPEGELTRVAVPLASRDDAGRALAHLRMLGAALPTGRIEAPLIHAHTGIFGGLPAVRLARPDARIVVTEHASFLPRVFARPAARGLYEEMLERVDVLLCVSGYLHEQVRREFPRHADKLRVVPNPIDFTAFAPRPEPPSELLRWLYVGRLVPDKGVLTLVDAFARVAADEPRATLTLVGSGDLAGPIRDRVTGHGLDDRVRVEPPVPPADVVRLMHGHDVLAHASRMETFGMTVVEAVASGLPVLVARSPGPQETLAGLDGTAGVLIDVSDDPDVIVDGYRRLRSLDTLDLDAARKDLVARYGVDSVRAQLLDAYRHPRSVGSLEPPAKPHLPDGRVDRVIVVALDPATNVGPLDDLLAGGCGVDLVTVDAGAWVRAGVDARVRIHAVGIAEQRAPSVRVERLLVRRAPGRALSIARRLARRVDALWPEAAVARAQRLHDRAARAFENRVWGRLYGTVRPRVVWRIVRRDVVPLLEKARIVGVVPGDGTAAGRLVASRLAGRLGVPLEPALPGPPS